MSARGLMTQLEVVELMKSSTNLEEWNANADTVRLMFGGQFPPFWWGATARLRMQKELEWGGLQITAGDVDEAFRRLREPGAPRIVFAEHVDVAPGSTANQRLELARQSLMAVRRGMQQFGVSPHQWLCALGKEAASMFGDNQDDRRTFEQLLEEWLHAVRGDSKDHRAAFRRARGLPAD